jgi:hypothetical protein
MPEPVAYLSHMPPSTTLSSSQLSVQRDGSGISGVSVGAALKVFTTRPTQLDAEAGGG